MSELYQRRTKYPTLRSRSREPWEWAFWIAISVIVIFVALEAKRIRQERKQRIEIAREIRRPE